MMASAGACMVWKDNGVFRVDLSMIKSVMERSLETIQYGFKR